MSRGAIYKPITKFRLHIGVMIASLQMVTSHCLVCGLFPYWKQKISKNTHFAPHTKKPRSSVPLRYCVFFAQFLNISSASFP